MVLKTFNVAEDTYQNFSRFCKELGINMSKQVELFMRSFIREEPEAKGEYLKRLKKIREGPYSKFNSAAELRAHIENAAV